MEFEGLWDLNGMKVLVELLVFVIVKMQCCSQDFEKCLQEIFNEVIQFCFNFEKVCEEVMIDVFIGIVNCKCFDEFLCKVCCGVDGNQKLFSLVFCDIDFFKWFNDIWGYQIGDQIICFVVGCLICYFDDVYFVVCYGGEEFGIVMLNIFLADVVQILEKIC